MLVETPARAQLAAYFSAPDALSQADLARRIGVSGASMHAWKSGDARPEAHFRLALQREIGLQADAWMTPQERAIAGGVAE